MRTNFRMLGLLLSVVAASVSLRANAQTTTTTGLISIYHNDGQLIPFTTATAAYYINRRDCGLDVYPANPGVTAKVNVTASANGISLGANPIIWVGNECQSSLNRSGTTPMCVQVLGGTVTAIPAANNNAYEIPVSSLRPIDLSTSIGTTKDICSAQGKLTFFLWAQSAGSGDIVNYVRFDLTADTAAPTTVTVTTPRASGDNQISLSYEGSFDGTSRVEYFSVPIAGNCDSPGTLDGGTSSDAGTDADAGFSLPDGGAAAPSSLVAGALPPFKMSGVNHGTADSTSSVRIDTGNIGLADDGTSAYVGFATIDLAGNYSVVSNLACVTKVHTYGLCDALDGGRCPQGGCTVSATPAPVGSLVLVGLACAILALRRGRTT